MSSRMIVDQVEDHVGGKFQWDIKPDCCDLLIAAVEDEKFVFVGNMGTKESNNFYMLPVTSDGDFARSDGVTISHCPWCGTKIAGRKKYPTG